MDPHRLRVGNVAQVDDGVRADRRRTDETRSIPLPNAFADLHIHLKMKRRRDSRPMPLINGRSGRSQS